MSLTDSDKTTRRITIRTPPGTRPSGAPLGPRVRHLSTLPEANPARFSRASTVSRSSTLFSHDVHGSSPERSEAKALDSSAEASSSASDNSPPTSAPPPASNESTPEPARIQSPAASPVTPLPKPPPFTSPPKVQFDSVPVAWKGLPLEAALWTFTSKELQDVVSRAIRSSAQESFIRLLSVQNLDHSVPNEIARLESLRLTKQARYRFIVQRRTMMLQALLSSSMSSNDTEAGNAIVSRLTSQLSEIVAECDLLAEELVKIADHIGQLNRLLDVHWGSALAIALRKLNGSYGKRTGDLIKAKERISQLEAELEDAWQEAEKLAKEMDEFDAVAEASDEEEAVIETAEIVSMPSSSPIARATAVITVVPMSPAALSPREPECIPLPASPTSSSHHTANASISQHLGDKIDFPRDVPEDGAHTDDEDDRASIRSAQSCRTNKSARSTRTQRSADTNRLSIVSAARKRSLRTSMGSLRLPRRVNDTRHSNRLSIKPPVPAIPQEYSPGLALPPPSAFSTRRTSFLNMDSRNASVADLGHTPPSGGVSPISPSPRADLDELNLLPHSASDVSSMASVPITTVDDIYIMPNRHLDDDEIQVVPRIQRLRRSVDDLNMLMNSNRIPVENRTGDRKIPSIWQNIDAPKTPAERVQFMLQQESTKNSPYHRLKSFTKRYSSAIPAIPRPHLTLPKSLSIRQARLQR